MFVFPKLMTKPGKYVQRIRLDRTETGSTASSAAVRVPLSTTCCRQMRSVSAGASDDTTGLRGDGGRRRVVGRGGRGSKDGADLQAQ